MDNQHKQIKGYRDLSQKEIDLMNKIKNKASEVGELVEELESTMCALEAGTDNPDAGWVIAGKLDLQKGFMSLVRSIAKPESF